MSFSSYFSSQASSVFVCFSRSHSTLAHAPPVSFPDLPAPKGPPRLMLPFGCFPLRIHNGPSALRPPPAIVHPASPPPERMAEYLNPDQFPIGAPFLTFFLNLQTKKRVTVLFSEANNLAFSKTSLLLPRIAKILPIVRVFFHSLVRFSKPL